MGMHPWHARPRRQALPPPEQAGSLPCLQPRYHPSPPPLPPRWVLIGGYLVNPASIPGWLRWVRSLSPLSFAFEVLAANEVADQYFAIHVDGFPEIGGIKGDGAPLPLVCRDAQLAHAAALQQPRQPMHTTPAPSPTVSFAPLSCPAVFLRTLGLNPSRNLQSAGALAAFYCGSCALAFAATSYTLWRRGGGSWRSALRRRGGGGGCCGGEAAAGGTGGGSGGGVAQGVHPHMRPFGRAPASPMSSNPGTPSKQGAAPRAPAAL